MHTKYKIGKVRTIYPSRKFSCRLLKPSSNKFMQQKLATTNLKGNSTQTNNYDYVQSVIAILGSKKTQNYWL